MLIEPVPLEPPLALGRVHFIAIGGAGMSAIAMLYAELGLRVSGSDRSDSPVLELLREAGVTVWVGHDAAHVAQADTVVVSSAIPDDNVELVAAREQGARIWHRSTALASLVLGRRGVAVTGTHGKTTTSAMTARVLSATGAEPGYVVGAVLGDTGRAAALGRGPDFVIEADESDGSFRQYPVETFVVTNIEADHLDNWGTPEAYYAGYAEAVRNSAVRQVVACLDDPGAARLVGELAAEGRRVVTYGTSAASDVRLVDVECEGTTSRAGLLIADERFELVLSVPGEHNLLNAAAAVSVGLLHMIPAAEAMRALAEFSGTSRRFEFIGDPGGIRVFDDYAHHPTEVAAALHAARSAVGEGRVIACFQPHLFSRTQTFATEFAEALSAADIVLVCPIFPAREDPIPGVTSDLIAAAMPTVRSAESLDAAIDGLARIARPGDLVLTIGAGDVTRVGRRLVERLEAQ